MIDFDYGATNGDIFPPPGWHICGRPTKEGRPCGRWVPDRFETCPWHRPKPSAAEVAARERARVARRRQRLMAKLVLAQAMLAACVPTAYATTDAWARALRVRKAYVRRFARELAALEGQ